VKLRKILRLGGSDSETSFISFVFKFGRRISLRKYSIILLVIAGFLCSGFRHTGPLKTYPTNPKNMENFNTAKFKKGQKIRLVNAQTSTTDFLIVKEPKGNQVAKNIWTTIWMNTPFVSIAELP